MQFLAPNLNPSEKLMALEASARRSSADPSTRAVANVLWQSLQGDRAQLAPALLELLAAPGWRGNTEVDGTRGQWINTDVANVATMGGDCVDRTHAMLALAYALGIDARAAWIVEPGALDHVAPVVRIGSRWFWADALARPARLTTDAPRGIAVHYAP